MRKAALFLLVSVLALSAQASTGSKEAVGESQQIVDAHTVRDFIGADGRFDLDAARRANYEGRIDLVSAGLLIDGTKQAPLLVRPVQLPESDSADIYWDNTLSPEVAGVGGGILAAAIYGGKLILAGGFVTAGDKTVSNIVAWDGSSWSQLGSGVSSTVYALTVYNGNLIAGGYFTMAGSVTANHVASWDGSTWSSLGTGIVGDVVYSLTAYGGRLVAGGSFSSAGGVSARNVASWDGSSWSALGTGMDGYVRALIGFDSNLFAGGGFSTAGGVQASKIACWDGTAWTELGHGVNGWVAALACFQGKLMVGGKFTLISDSAVTNVAAWDGSGWSALGQGTDNDVRSLTVYGDKLVAGGTFTQAGGVESFGIASWDGGSWTPYSSGIRSGSYAGCVYVVAAFGGDLVAGGGFDVAGSVSTRNIAFWNGSNWWRPGTGTDGSVYALAVYAGRLIAGGSFTMINSVAANHIAAWDRDHWVPLGAGTDSCVYSLVEYGGQLIAGGSFVAAGGAPANRIAAWNGSVWSPLGEGVNGAVYALTVCDSALAAGGWFTSAGGAPASYVAQWNGQDWSPLGLEWNGIVYSLTVYGGRLVRGGESGVALWAGGGWTTLATRYTIMPRAMVNYDGTVVAAGPYATLEEEYSAIRAWDGRGWSTLDWAGCCSRDLYLALGVYGGNLIARTYSSGVESVASWDGSSWSRLGSGVGGQMLAVAVFNGQLVVGGNFATAGGKVSSGLAVWTHQLEPALHAVRVESVQHNYHVVDGTPVMSWHYFDSQSPQTGFEIAVGTDTNWTYAEMWNPAPFNSADSFVVYGGASLTRGHTYYFRVRVSNGTHWSPWAYSSFRLNTPPSMPVPRNPINNALAGSMPVLWATSAVDAEGDPLTYDFVGFHDTDCVSGPSINILNVPGTPDSTGAQIPAPLAENCRYWWNVRAFDGYEYSAASPYATFMVDGTPEPPTMPALIEPPSTDGKPVFTLLPTLKWSGSTDPDPFDTVRYKVEVSINPSFTFEYVKDSLLTTQFTLVDSLFFGTHYYWRVTARDKTGLTAVSSVKEFWTFVMGDINASHLCDLSDLSGLVSYLTGGGYVISPLMVADLNGSCLVDLTDLSMMVSYLTGGGVKFKVGC